MGRIAAIDIGTNTTLLLIAEQQGGDIVAVAERAEITRLGRGIGTGGDLHPDNVARTLKALRTFADLARQHDATICAVGTEGLRRATNAETFLKPAAEILGGPVQVIGGEREAELSFLAATRSFAKHAGGRLLVVDIGGGSTEFIFARDGRIHSRCSLPLGSVRLTEAHFQNDPPSPEQIAAATADIGSKLAAIPTDDFFAQAGRDLVVIGTAGTVTTLAAMTLQLSSYDQARVHGYTLCAGDLSAQLAQLRHSTQAQRALLPGLDPGRADVILAGAVLLHAILRWSGVQQVLVSDRGVRWGLVHDWFEAQAP